MNNLVIEGKSFFSKGVKSYAHEAVVQECKASYLESRSLSQCQPGDKNIADYICVRLSTCTSMAADALTFRPQGYMDFILIPGDKMALEDQINLCVRR